MRNEVISQLQLVKEASQRLMLLEEKSTINYFIEHIDAAAVYVNTSTAFTDGGQFGMGAEIGISTQKLHARGPMSLEALMSYKWVIFGDGQIRS